MTAYDTLSVRKKEKKERNNEPKYSVCYNAYNVQDRDVPCKPVLLGPATSSLCVSGSDLWSRLPFPNCHIPCSMYHTWEAIPPPWNHRPWSPFAGMEGQLSTMSQIESVALLIACLTYKGNRQNAEKGERK